MPEPEDLKSPLIEENQDGTYSITFYYQSPDPSVNQTVTLDSDDLYEWMIDETTGEIRAFSEENPTEKPGLYSLKLEGIPSGALFATYRFKIENDTAAQIVHDAANKNSLLIGKLNLLYDFELMSSLDNINSAKEGTVYLNENPKAYFVKGMKKAIFLPEDTDLTHLAQKLEDPDFKMTILAITANAGHIQPTRQVEKIEDIVAQTTSYIKLPENAELPAWARMKPTSKIDGTVMHEKYGDKSAAGTLHQERDVWIYKPKGFDELTKSDKKVIFMLDGRDMCERLAPSIAQAHDLSNTAIVFINPGEYKSPIPGRVQEYYYDPEKTTEFVDLLSYELIPHYAQELGVVTRNVILEAHSLAAYPMTAVANKIPDKIGGLILVSPALNQQKELLPKDPRPEFKKIPISIQIGRLENAEPPTDFSDSSKDTYRDLKPESRLASNQKLHAHLLAHGYSVSQDLTIHSSGHDAMNIVSGTTHGMKFIQNCWAKTDTETIARARDMKYRLNEIIKNRNTPSVENIEKKSLDDSSSPFSTTPKLKF